MKAIITIKKEVELTTLSVKAGARYWEDTSVNGVEDTDGSLIPCREGEYWCPNIDIESGVITNWTKGVTAEIHYKVCDDGFYKLIDSEGNIVLSKEDYVPSILDLYKESFGDYIILSIDENGLIADWKNNPNISDFKSID